MENIKTATVEELEARKAQIGAEAEKEGADLTALQTEVRKINAELETRKAAAAAREEIRRNVSSGYGAIIERGGVKNQNADEIRNSRRYIDAYAEYIKTEDPTECRALLTENAADGTVAIPDLVDEVVRHAWENEEIVNLVKKSYIKGNLKVGFEISATGAVVHTEGGDPVDPETLELGIVKLIPESIKKFVEISDEAMDMRGEAFLTYIYSELAYRIAKKLADLIIADIVVAPAESTSTAVGVPAFTSTTIEVGLVAEALGYLSDEATNPVVMMNKATWSEFKKAQYDNGFNVDPFEGLKVVFNNTITAFATATTGVTYAIVGDLGRGAQVNLPNGQGIEFKFDDKTKMHYDLIRVLGREYAAHGIVGPGCFVKITA